MSNFNKSKIVAIVGQGLPLGKLVELTSSTTVQQAASEVVIDEVHVHLCDVCKKNEMQGVYSSSCGPISFAYCGECAVKGAEPYGALVAYISGAWTLSEWDDKKTQEYYRPNQLVKVTLEVAGKTFEEFVIDVRAAIVEYD
jgi:hypothetical protein